MVDSRHLHKCFIRLENSPKHPTSHTLNHRSITSFPSACFCHCHCKLITKTCLNCKMLPTYDQKKPTKTTLPTFNTCNPDASQTISLTPYFVYFNLTISSLTTFYRAYEHSDYPVVAFVVFVYVSYFVLEKCLAVYTRLPRGEQSVKKELLRFTLWGLSSAILFGFAYQFGTFMHLTAVVLMYCVAISNSLLLFYTYYIVDDQNHNGYSFCGTMPPQSSPNHEKTNNSDNV